MFKIKKETVHLLNNISNTILSQNFADAVTMWCLGMKELRDCNDECCLGGQKCPSTCAQCLEGGLRAINLYLHPPMGLDCQYLKAAKALQAWTLTQALLQPPLQQAPLQQAPACA